MLCHSASDLIMKAESLLASSPQKDGRHDIALTSSWHSAVTIPPTHYSGPAYDVIAILDPTTRAAQKYTPVIMVCVYLHHWQFGWRLVLVCALALLVWWPLTCTQLQSQWICFWKTRPNLRYNYRVSKTPGNTGNLLEFEIPPGNTGNLLDFCWCSWKNL